VISDHHGDLDARPRGFELIENGLVRFDDVFKLFRAVHEGELPETKCITHDDQFGAGAFFFQSVQKRDEFGSVIAMLQLSIASHVQIADEVIPMWHALAPRPMRYGLVGCERLGT
jgi:hypothetical protein